MMVGIVVIVIQILKSSDIVLIVFVSILQQQLQPQQLQLHPHLQRLLQQQLQPQLQPLPPHLLPPHLQPHSI